MVRIGLTLYLMLSTAVGPALCCCLPGDFLALCLPASSVRHSCCGYHAGRTEQSPGTPSPGPQKDCPCKKDQPQPVVFTPTHQSAASEYTRPLMLPQGTVVGDCLLGAAHFVQGHAPREPISYPYHNSRDLLRALRILRC
jgi:hypothetical protein